MGTKNRLSARVLQDMLDVWEEIATPPTKDTTTAAADAAIKSLKARKLAELREAGDEREVYFVQPWNGEELAKLRAGEKLDPVYDKEPLVIITGVPRAGRDPEPPRVTPVPTSAPPTRTAERQPEGVALRVSTTLGERDLYMKHHPHPTPPPDMSEPAQRHYVRATIAPRSEADPGAVVEGSFTASSDGMVRVCQGNQLLGSSPYKPGDDVEAIARKLLREKSGSGGFWGPLPSIH